jgi:hypothetical protein
MTTAARSFAWTLVTIALAACAEPVVDHGPRWQAGGALAVPRSFPALVDLGAGSALVTGGRNAFFGPLASTEIFDSGEGAWRPGPDLLTPRVGMAFAALPGGGALVAGGAGVAGPLSSSEWYDPVTGAWRPTSALSGPRFGPAFARLADGRVLVAGGLSAWSGPASISDGAEIFDPATGQYTPTGSLRVARYLASATVLPSGDVLVVGGCLVSLCDVETAVAASAERWNPVSGQWSDAGDLPRPRLGHTATVLDNGMVLVAGGGSADVCAPGDGRAYLYDPAAPAASAWRETGPLAIGRITHVAWRLSSGRVLVAGGTMCVTDDGSSEFYDPATGLWSPGPPMSAPHGNLPAAVALPGVGWLVVGGLRDGPSSSLGVSGATDLFLQ